MNIWSYLSNTLLLSLHPCSLYFWASVPFFFHISHIAGTTELTGFTISPTTAWHLGKKNAWKMQIQKGCDQFAAATSKWSTSSKMLQASGQNLAQASTMFLACKCPQTCNWTNQIGHCVALRRRQFRHWSSASLFGPVTHALLSWYKMTSWTCRCEELNHVALVAVSTHGYWARYSLQARPEHYWTLAFHGAQSSFSSKTRNP